jgi:hypothetical protein
MTADYRVMLFVALTVFHSLAGCATSDRGPAVTGGPERFNVSIGIDRADSLGGPESPAVKHVLEEEIRRKGYCPAGVALRLVGNTAAQYRYLGRCTTNEESGKKAP